MNTGSIVPSAGSSDSSLESNARPIYNGNANRNLRGFVQNAAMNGYAMNSAHAHGPQFGDKHNHDQTRNPNASHPSSGISRTAQSHGVPHSHTHSHLAPSNQHNTHRFPLTPRKPTLSSVSRQAQTNFMQQQLDQLNLLSYCQYSSAQQIEQMQQIYLQHKTQILHHHQVQMAQEHQQPPQQYAPPAHDHYAEHPSPQHPSHHHLSKIEENTMSLASAASNAASIERMTLHAEHEQKECMHEEEEFESKESLETPSPLQPEPNHNEFAEEVNSHHHVECKQEIVSIMGDRVVLVPPIELLQELDSPFFSLNASNGLRGYSVGGYTLRHCGPRILRNSSLKRASTTFESRRPRMLPKKVEVDAADNGPQARNVGNGHDHGNRNTAKSGNEQHVADTKHHRKNEHKKSPDFVQQAAAQRHIRKMMLPQLMPTRRRTLRSLSCGALTPLSVVKE